MATPVPKNVAAALGLVPTVLGGVRRLPTKAVQLPVMALGTALSGLDAARREYEELAERGEKLIARLRGGSLELLEGSVDSVLGTSTDNAKQAADATAKRARERAEADKAVQQTLPVDEPAPAAKTETAASKDETPAPKAETPAPTKVDSAATPEVVAQVEKVSANVLSHLDGDEYELPLEDYDGMTLGALRGRLRSLDMQQLVVLRDYEKSRAHRLPVITMLDNRIAKLSSGESTPTGSTPDTPSDKASTDSKSPKNVGATAAAKNSPAPPHTKVRIT
jgi:chemotaxis protein histidine kinase CheA